MAIMYITFQTHKTIYVSFLHGYVCSITMNTAWGLHLANSGIRIRYGASFSSICNLSFRNRSSEYRGLGVGDRARAWRA